MSGICIGVVVTLAKIILPNTTEDFNFDISLIILFEVTAYCKTTSTYAIELKDLNSFDNITCRIIVENIKADGTWTEIASQMKPLCIKTLCNVDDERHYMTYKGVFV